MHCTGVYLILGKTLLEKRIVAFWPRNKERNKLSLIRDEGVLGIQTWTVDRNGK